MTTDEALTHLRRMIGLLPEAEKQSCIEPLVTIAEALKPKC